MMKIDLVVIVEPIFAIRFKETQNYRSVSATFSWAYWNAKMYYELVTEVNVRTEVTSIISPLSEESLKFINYEFVCFGISLYLKNMRKSKYDMIDDSIDSICIRISIEIHGMEIIVVKRTNGYRFDFHFFFVIIHSLASLCVMQSVNFYLPFFFDYSRRFVLLAALFISTFVTWSCGKILFPVAK